MEKFNLDEEIKNYFYDEDDESYMNMDPDQVNQMLSNCAYGAVRAYIRYLYEQGI